MTVTDSGTDLGASDVAWDLDPLLDGRSVDDLLDTALQIAQQLATRRGTIASLDVPAMVDVMESLGEVNDLVGRAGSYAALRFAVDTADPERGAQLQRVDERGTALTTELLFLELEWAAVPDDARRGASRRRSARVLPASSRGRAPVPPASAE